MPAREPPNQSVSLVKRESSGIQLTRCLSRVVPSVRHPSYWFNDIHFVSFNLFIHYNFSAIHLKARVTRVGEQFKAWWCWWGTSSGPLLYRVRDTPRERSTQVQLCYDTRRVSQLDTHVLHADQRNWQFIDWKSLLQWMEIYCAIKSFRLEEWSSTRSLPNRTVSKKWKVKVDDLQMRRIPWWVS